MSDFHAVTKKLKEGAEWRGDIRVTIKDEEHELTVRQLYDPEFEEVMEDINKDELQELQEQMPQDALEEYRELREKDELDESESERFAELEEELEESDVDMFDVLSTSTFKGIRKCAKYGVEPDEEDLQAAIRNRASELEAEYGIRIRKPEDAREPLKEEYKELVDKSTDFVAFQIGLQVLMETLGDEGN